MDGGLFGPAAPSATLDAESETALWRRWHDARDADAREALVGQYLGYARALAARSFARRPNPEFEFGDYFHFAAIGMFEAFERFDPERSARFRTYATPRILGAMLDGLEKLSERQQQICLWRRHVQDRLASQRESQSAGGSDAQLLRRLGDIGIGMAIGFLLEGTGMVLGAETTLPDDAYSQAEARQMRERLWRVVDRLTPREAQVIRRHYLQHQPFEEIARELGLTRGRISQLHRQAIERLRQALAGVRLELSC
ncbi:sigma-70 family RNA polymerase sigma factor [Ramlibacter sp.]|uniref:sigma-70 family RNA polymerase sigma factor n=1 Tax=Ramlibacter sp. TaxID=1917967 RepID=UPI003D14E5CA